MLKIKRYLYIKVENEKYVIKNFSIIFMEITII